jgi:hypothetical protein
MEIRRENAIAFPMSHLRRSTKNFENGNLNAGRANLTNSQSLDPALD